MKYADQFAICIKMSISTFFEAIDKKNSGSTELCKPYKPIRTHTALF